MVGKLRRVPSRARYFQTINSPDFKALTDYIHGLGLKFGIYSSPGHITCGGHVGSYQHEEIDAKTWERWGVDYLKYDYCGYLEIEKRFGREDYSGTLYRDAQGIG